MAEHHPADQLVLHEALHVLADYVRLKTPASTRT